MKRRAFLKSAASSLPIALFSPTFSQPYALAEGPAPELHVVPAGQDLFGQKRSRGYSLISFKTSTQQTGGSSFTMEHSNLVPGGPPTHLHLEQEEWFYVLDGEILFQIGEKRMQLKAGDSVLAPRKIPHAFSAVGSKPARLLISFTPAGKMEQFFRDTAIPNAPHEDAAFYRKYDMELIGPPIKLT